MRTYLRFRLGPLVSYQRLGRTQAQNRAAAKARAARKSARAGRRSAREYNGQTDTVRGPIVGFENGRILVQAVGAYGYRILKVRAGLQFTEGQLVEVRYQRGRKKPLSARVPNHPDPSLTGHDWQWFEVPGATVTLVGWEPGKAPQWEPPWTPQ